MTDNIILLTIDSLRADHCGFIDDRATTTPYLDRLARDGLVFENAIAPGPRTPSSVPPTFTGEFYDYEGVSVDDISERRQRIARHLARYTSFAERLRKRGYSTAAVTANPWTAPDTNFDAGFDVFCETGGNGAGKLDSLEQFPLLRTIDNVLRRTGNEERFGWHRRREWFSHWTGFYETIRERVNELEEPFFAWIFLLDPHQPYVTPKAFREELSAPEMYYSIYRFWNERDGEIPNHVGTRLRRAYRDTVRSADAFVERLDRDVIDDDIVLVVHSDHGEALGDHGVYGHEYHLYEENVHVPLLVAGGPSSGRVENPVSLLELPEIITGLTRTKPQYRTEQPDPTGASHVISRVESRSVASGRAEQLEYVPHHAAVRMSRWKYLRTANGEELYDLAEDPRERENVLTENEDVRGILEEVLERHEDRATEKAAITDANERLVRRTQPTL